TALYTLSLHDALPIYCAEETDKTPFCPTSSIGRQEDQSAPAPRPEWRNLHLSSSWSIPTPTLARVRSPGAPSRHKQKECQAAGRSEEHTSELQSRENL